jgi:hypothetical protein
MKKATYFYLLRRGFFSGGGVNVIAGLISDFKARVETDGGTLESESCLTTDLTFLTENP